MASGENLQKCDDGLEQIIVDLFKVEGVKFGSFTLKSGIQSPAYFDLRVIVSYPNLMKQVSELLWNAAAKVDEKFVSVCGVPYTALPIATVMSVEHNVPMLIRRREAKDYGTKKMIEGKYKTGDVCLVVEDVVTSGSSVFETVQLLQEYGLIVKDAVVLLDREQGGSERLLKDGIKLHSVITMTQLVSTLLKKGLIEDAMHQKVLQFVAENKFDGSGPEKPIGDQPAKRSKSEMTYKERAALCTNPVASQLLTIMETKQSNLVLSADLTNSQQILQICDQVGSKICMVKTHVDIIDDFTPEFTTHLSQLATKHNFLIFEDRKFCDIGNTAQHQYEGGVYKIADWAHLVNAHAVPGPGVIQGLKQAGAKRNRACLLIAEMSSSGNLAKGDYTKATLKMAEDDADFVIGFISQSRISDNPAFIHMTPGVKLQAGTDALGQQYNTPENAILANKSDLIIVGRGILQAADPLAEAEKYREAGYKAYMERIS